MALDTKAVAAPATHSQSSRKGKKAWRKNVDISDVQQGLEDVREDLIKGGVVGEKPSDELFTTDAIGDAEVGKRGQGKKLLKAEEILARRSAVAGLDGRKRKMEEVVINDGAKRQKDSTYVSHKDLQRLRAIADRQALAISVENEAAHDPWDVAKEQEDPRFSFLDKPQPKKEPVTLKHAPGSLTTSSKRQPSIRKPHAGKSYNPLAGDWSALLEREGAAVVEAEQRRLEVEAETAAAEARALAEAAKVEAAEKDEYATDYDSAWESEWEGLQSESERQQVWTQKQKGRKTPAERNKVNARKEREAKEKMERKQKERDVAEKKITQIAKEVSARDKARKAHAMALIRAQHNNDSSASSDDDRNLRRSRFGKLAVPDAPLEVVLPEELEDSLRRLKPEGNLLTDRYRNLLVSGKMEVRRKKGAEQHAKPKRSRSEKWSYKDWKLR